MVNATPGRTRVEHGLNESDAERIADDTVCLERLLPGPIERVWAWLTEPELRRRWLAGGPMALHPGGDVALQFRHAELSSDPDPAAVPERYRDVHTHGHVLHGRVTVCEPPHRLAFTWGNTGQDASEVCFELTPHGDRVHLRLRHRRLREDDMVSVASGWHTHLTILIQALHGDPMPDFWPLHGRLETRYRALLHRH